MLPKKLPPNNHQKNAYNLPSNDIDAQRETSGGIIEAQECTEAGGWSRAWREVHHSHTPSNEFRHTSETHQNESSENGIGDFARVSLSRSPSLEYQPTQFFVRAAGGMSIPMPEFHSVQNRRMEGNQHHTRSPPQFHSVPQLDNVSLAMIRQSEDESSGNPSKKPSNYLPLSVELVAGRGTTSIPSDGNKNSSGSVKVKSQPPSKTLAMSASLFKNYLIPSGEKSQPDAENSVKTKMLGIWNNVKYGWTVNLKTNFSRDSPVYLLANVYHKSFGEPDAEPCEEIEENGMEAFKRHFYSLIWCTYRRQFPMLQNSTLTTDCGWGCMLRSGQMMVAHALIVHFLSSRWRHIKHVNQGSEEIIHQRIIQWLGDSPSDKCPLSLHNLVHLGNRLGKKAGDWYGPASVAYIFKEAIELGSKYIHDLQRICVYVAQDCAVYIQDVLDLTTTQCVCNKGDLVELSEKANVKGKPTSHYLEQIKVVSPSTINSAVENGSSGNRYEKEYSSDVRSKLYANTKDVSRHTLSASDSKAFSESRNSSHGLIEGNQAEWTGGSSGFTARENDVAGSAKTEEPIKQCSKCNNWRSLIIMVPVRLGAETLNPIYASPVCSLFTHDLCIGIIGGRPKHSLYFVGFQEEHLIHLDPHLCQDAVMVTQPNFPLSSYHCSSPRKMALQRMDPSATLGFYCHTQTDFCRLMEELPELLTPKEPGFDYPIFEFVDGRSEDADALARQLTDEDLIAAAFPRDAPLLPQDSEEFVFI